MDVIQTGRALGAEITGIDLSKDVSATQREFIFNAWTKNLALLFRGQRLSFAESLAAARSVRSVWASGESAARSRTQEIPAGRIRRKRRG
jgi:alpha-ketoglutarate-dependent taurine dioxygenase